MKFTRTFLLLLLVATSLIYTLTSFVMFDFNPSSWSEDVRGSLVCLWFMLVAPTMAITAVKM